MGPKIKFKLPKSPSSNWNAESLDNIYDDDDAFNSDDGSETEEEEPAEMTIKLKSFVKTKHVDFRQ